VREHLFVISQLAVAFAGFASLATVLGRRTKPQSALDAARFRVLLLYSVPVAFLALLPGVFADYGLDAPSNWRVACGVLVVVYLALGRPLSAGLAQTRVAGLRHHPANVALITVLSGVPVLACAAAALGFGSSVAAPTFVLALILLLLVAAFTFARLILSLISDEPDA
jgi:hypothetical protein